MAGQKARPSPGLERNGMLKDIAILARAGAMARHASERHSLIAQNIANADTPGYRAKELKPFDVSLVDAARKGDRTSRNRLSRSFEITGLDAAPNGNTVSVEDQMARSVDAQSQHKAAMTIYRKALELMRMSVSNKI